MNPDTKSISKYFYIYLFVTVMVMLLGLKQYIDSKDKVNHLKWNIIDNILILLVPIFSYVMFESTTGSLGTVKEIHLIVINILCFYTIYLLVFIILNNTKLTIILVSTVLFILSLVEFYISAFRGRPLMLGDFELINTSLSIVSTYNFFLNKGILTGLALYCVMLVIGCMKTIKVESKVKRLVYSIIILCLVSVNLYGLFSGYIVKKYNLTVNQWSPLSSYQENGFILSTIVSYKMTSVEKPANYSKDHANEILLGVDEENSIGTTYEKPENLIVIMNESLADFSVINEFETNENVTPIMDNLKKNVWKGNLYVSAFGGSTANTEYEFLTGNTTAFIPNSIIAYQNYIRSDSPSIVKTIKQDNFETLAYHPYYPENYNRDGVYPLLGFNEFLSLEDYKGNMLRWWPNDSDMFKELAQIHKEKQNNEKLFMFNVTMQNHGPYDDQTFTSHIQLAESPDKYPQTEQYLSLVNLTDKAFGELTSYFESVEEKTLIVMFGDHYPNVETEFLESLYGKPMSALTNEETMKMYQTPFIIWANYDIGYKYIDKISTNFLGTFLMKNFGFETTVYQDYLYDLYSKTPVISTIGVYDAEGVFYPWDSLSVHEELINGYRIVQYNNIFDNGDQLEGVYD